MSKYRGRVAGMLIVFLLVIIWDFIFYFLLENSINLPLDLLYTVILCVVGFYSGKFYDINNNNLQEMKEKEAENKKINDEMQHVLQNIEEVVFRTDEKGHFLYLNQAWQSLSGYSVIESLYKNAFHFLSLGDRQEILPLLKRLKDEGKDKHKFDVSYQKKEGGILWGEIHLKFHYDNNGRFIGTVGTIMDITDRIHTEEELLEMNEELAIESQKLAVAGQLAAGIAHEVRNPLTSISGFLQLMRDNATKKQKEYLDIIFAEIKRIELVLGELLILAKPQAVVFKEFNIVDTLYNVSQLLNTNAILYNVNIHTEFQKNTLNIRGDENQLKQVFINLIKNGIESMSNGGTITIKAGKDNGKVFVSVEDEGAGMKKETLDKLGEPFFTTKTKGTGLGLTICLRILRDHRADVQVQSFEGEGTTFRLNFEEVKLKKKWKKSTGMLKAPVS
jgi:two-component system, sporulation sensor kinase C